jgi:hypothetical protein
MHLPILALVLALPAQTAEHGESAGSPASMPEPPAPATGPAVPRLLVMPLEGRSGVPSHEVQVLGDLLMSEARRIPGHKVVTFSDVEQMLSLETKQQLLGCDATSCLAEIGGALNADEVLYGSVGRLGRHELVLSLSRIRPRDASALGGESERLSGANADATLDGVPRVLARLYPSYVPPEPRVRPMNPALVLGIITVAGAAIQYGAFSSVFTSLLFVPCPVVMAGAMATSAALCVAAPVYVSALQAWLADVLGRRQAGYRRAAVLGLLGVALSGGQGLVGAATAACIGFLATFLLAGLVDLGHLDRLVANRLPDLPGLKAEVGSGRWHRVVLAMDRPAVACAVLGVLPGVLGLVLAVPLAQALVLVLTSRERPRDAEASPPGLYSPLESPPWFLGWLPGWLLGGQPPEPFLAPVDPRPSDTQPPVIPADSLQGPVPAPATEPLSP